MVFLAPTLLRLRNINKLCFAVVLAGTVTLAKSPLAIAKLTVRTRAAELSHIVMDANKGLDIVDLVSEFWRLPATLEAPCN